MPCAMQLYFTFHALLRCRERGILQEEVEQAIAFPEKRIVEGHRWFYTKHIGRGRIEVCAEMSKTHIKIITVYWVT
jgi:hypothetical protein